MQKKIFKRGIAYIIDIVIVIIIVGMLSFIPSINKASKSLTEYNNEISKMEQDLKIGTITKEEYNNKIIDIKYSLDKESINYSIICIVVIILYFDVFQYFNKGQTLGKKLMKIKVVGKEKKLTIFNYFLRSLIVNNLFSMIICIICLLITNKNIYYTLSSGVSNIGSFLLYATFVFVLWRSDERGLHDIIGGTIVICEDEVEESKKESTKKKNYVENKIVEAVYEEN